MRHPEDLELEIDTLNLRAGPSFQDRAIDELNEGDVVRNLGCKRVDGQRWCQVARSDDDRTRGWVAGRSLRESSYQP
ncbi:SH3 domain-containing protein [Thiobaca trueperi]|uniref:SH3 domain-containing protein n=1 Tax=Thiobaca trueperi TaxID=127458 RepID=A0A4R3N2T2_9GAMM|nr:SH3 domain-containing protein [Thiobaca trueperi]TCT21363.1 SH3 domain-containing protein [Thiobaca trueperi]